MTRQGSRLSDHLFFKVGIPTSLSVGDVRPKLCRAADRLFRRIETHAVPGLRWRLARRIDRFVMKRFMFMKDAELYAYPVERYRQRGWM